MSFTVSQSLLRFMSIESVILSNHLILCCPLLLLPSVFRMLLQMALFCSFLWPSNIPLCIYTWGFPDSSVGKESACVAGDPGSVLESGRSAGEGQATHSCIPGFPCGSAGKESACSAGNWGWTPGLGRSPGEGKGYALQYFGLENSI